MNIGSTTQKHWHETSYVKLVESIQYIAQNYYDVYALALYYYCDDDEPCFPKVELNFNTIEQFESQISEASSQAEAKWNYAYWLQEPSWDIGGENDQLLAQWFEQTPFYYSQKQMEYAEQEDDALFNELLEKGEQFAQLFITQIIKMVQQLFSENILQDTFGKNLPVIIHELEYYEEPISWTKRANPSALINEFMDAYESDFS
jgi:hypothetical protein